MSKIKIALSCLILIPQLALAQADDCNTVYKVAGAVMIQRQTGATKEWLLAPNGRPAPDVAKMIIQDAFRVPRMSAAERDARDLTRNFANKWRTICLNIEAAANR